MTNARVRAPENVVAMPPAAPTTPDAGWSPAAADLRSLGSKGKKFVREWNDVHVCSLREGIIVMAAARALDEADRWHRKSRVNGKQQSKHARLALLFEKQFSALLSQLRVTS